MVAWARGTAVCNQALGNSGMMSPCCFLPSYVDNVDCMGRSFCPACHHTWQEGPLEKRKRSFCSLSLLLEEGISLCFLFLLVIETAFDKALSFSTFVVRKAWKSSPNNVSFADGRSPFPNLLQEWINCDQDLRSSRLGHKLQMFPIIHSEYCIRVSTSEAGTAISGSFPAHYQAKVATLM